MEPIDYTKYLILSLLVIAWCVLHSLMISVSVTEYLKKCLGPKFRFYRLFFNLIAILTLIPVALFAYSIVGTYLEERKLIGEFGKKYIAYQKRVSMLIPYLALASGASGPTTRFGPGNGLPEGGLDRRHCLDRTELDT